MSTQEQLIQEIRNQPERILRDVLHYVRFLERQYQEEEWSDVLPGHEVEQEVLDISDDLAGIKDALSRACAIPERIRDEVLRYRDKE